MVLAIVVDPVQTIWTTGTDAYEDEMANGPDHDQAVITALRAGMREGDIPAVLSAALRHTLTLFGSICKTPYRAISS